MSSEIDEMMSTLREHLAVKDSNGHTMVQVALIATVYFENAYRPDVRDAVVDVCEDYLQRCRSHLRWAMNMTTGQMEPFGEGIGAKPRSYIPPLPEDEVFEVMWHGAEHEDGASEFWLNAYGNERRPFVDLGYVQLSFPLLWFAENPGSLPDVLLYICGKLKPVSGYSGIGVVESYKTSAYAPLVYRWAQRFPGIEVDYPSSHLVWLLRSGRPGGGIKGVNWLTAIADRWLDELGGVDKVTTDLAALDSGFMVRRFEGGVVIQAGPRPQIGDAGRDVWPGLYVKLAKYLKPVRITDTGPFQRGGPGERFDRERSKAWLRRFDDR